MRPCQGTLYLACAEDTCACMRACTLCVCMPEATGAPSQTSTIPYHARARARARVRVRVRVRVVCAPRHARCLAVVCAFVPCHARLLGGVNSLISKAVHVLATGCCAMNHGPNAGDSRPSGQGRGNQAVQDTTAQAPDPGDPSPVEASVAVSSNHAHDSGNNGSMHNHAHGVNVVECIDSPPTAGFDHHVPDDTYECHFNNTSVEPRAHDDGSVEEFTWLWNLGDGSSSTDYMPVHTYASVGKYTVVLTATDECGRTSCSTEEVLIGVRTPSPNAFLNWVPAPATSQLHGHMPTFVL